MEVKVRPVNSLMGVKREVDEKLMMHIIGENHNNAGYRDDKK